MLHFLFPVLVSIESEMSLLSHLIPSALINKVPSLPLQVVRQASKKAGGSDQASLIDLGGESKEDEWQSWEDDAWASLERK